MPLLYLHTITMYYNSYLSLEQPHQENDCTEENENFY